MPKSKFPRKVREEIVTRSLPTLAKIVEDELAKIERLRFYPGEAQNIASDLAHLKLANGNAEANFAEHFKRMGIADKIQGLHRAFAAEGISLRQTYAFFEFCPNFLAYKTETLQSKIELIAKLLKDRDLPPPSGGGLPRTMSMAIKMFFDNTVYASFCKRADEEICTIALLAKLKDISLSQCMQRQVGTKVIVLTNADRTEEINSLLAVVSDARWAGVAHLAKMAGFKRPVYQSPEQQAKRQSVFKAAQKKFEARKLQS